MITLMIEKGDRVVYHTSYNKDKEKQFIGKNGLFLPKELYNAVNRDISLLEENLSKIHKGHKKINGISECDIAYIAHTLDDGSEEVYYCKELKSWNGGWHKF